jgi:opacity protein-like surface antigen
MLRIASACLVALLAGTAAHAQTVVTPNFRVDFSSAVKAAKPLAGVSLTSTPAARQGGAMELTGMVLGGFSFNGAGGFAVGGGVLGTNFLGNEHYMLQIDGLFENVGECAFNLCDVNQIAIGAMWLYRFSETSSGWVPFAGGGIVWSRLSLDFDPIGVGCGLLNIDCSTSVSGVGVQLAGGVDKNQIGVEFRFGGVHGGGGAILFRYRFKGN